MFESFWEFDMLTCHVARTLGSRLLVYFPPCRLESERKSSRRNGAGKAFQCQIETLILAALLTSLIWVVICQVTGI